jgi:starch synthase (maltosyl-transferring)
LAIFLLSLLPTAAPSGLDEASYLGFDGLLCRARQPLLDPQPFSATGLLAAAHEAGLRFFLEADLAEIAADSELVERHPALFSIRRMPPEEGPIDPRRPFAPSGTARAHFRAAEAADLLLPRIVASISDLAAAGVDGFILRGAEGVSSQVLERLAAAVRADAPQATLFACTSSDELVGLASAEEVLIDIAEATDAGIVPGRLIGAAINGCGFVVPDHMLASSDEPLRKLLARAVRVAGAAGGFSGESRMLTDSHARVSALLRVDAPDARYADRALLILSNAEAVVQPAPEIASLMPFMGADFGSFSPIEGEAPVGESLAPLEVRLLAAKRATPILMAQPGDVIAAAQSDRLVIEDVRPRVDDGAFAVKRIVGEVVTVDATIFADGHEQLAAELLWRPIDEDGWRRVRMAQLPNDQWRASFTLERLGRHEFQLEAWLDRFGGYRRDLAKKLGAGVAQSVDYAEGRALIEAALARAEEDIREQVQALAAKLADVAEDESSASLLLSPEVATLMDLADDRPHCLRSGVQPLDAERMAARFSSWYELFPRSQTDDPHRHGRFADVAARVPAIKAMGFDTLYFPPIHPIGRTNRKGPNNTLTPAADDPGSPYAIGAPEGGHDAIHPELGTFEDFRQLIEAAHAHGLEIALDFAIQCSPDHPWLKEHPGWFAWRPDGSMKYAENPPKKYQDIVNVDFYAVDAIPGLWAALRDIVLLWVSHGVKTFRVDNPHTKPLPFWEWMIGVVRARHPEVIFLAEAFTRPAIMYRLAKIGFSQSYTYFTWRDGKRELTDYIVELTTTAPKEFYRPHLFVNTPDINPPFLQLSGRPGFRIRAVLAATLSGLFGVYSGFELCEAAALPGREEYLDSEKYEIKLRDWNAPGNIIPDITLLNRLRRQYPALQTHLNTRFYLAQDDGIIWYGKPAPDGSHIIMVMVSLDPHAPRETDFEVPLWEFGLPDQGAVDVEDLAGGYRFRWWGKTQHIRLDPSEPYRIWYIAPGDGA